MSADNEIRIIEVNNEFIIINCFVEDEDGNGVFIAKSKKLENAIRIANKYMVEEPVEYGLKIVLKDIK